MLPRLSRGGLTTLTRMAANSTTTSAMVAAGATVHISFLDDISLQAFTDLPGETSSANITNQIRFQDSAGAFFQWNPDGSQGFDTNVPGLSVTASVIDGTGAACNLNAELTSTDGIPGQGNPSSIYDPGVCDASLSVTGLPAARYSLSFQSASAARCVFRGRAGLADVAQLGPDRFWSAPPASQSPLTAHWPAVGGVDATIAIAARPSGPDTTSFRG